ncbi:MAG TPA: exodeoxyribonuclease VII large subunit [Magnetospirillaceae bacterium]|jgi:exodeoxyribonuclease VII large subunit
MSESDTPTALPNVPEFTVSEISTALKRTVESEFEHVRVRGEISGLKRHSSGHLYYALKDSEAVLDAVSWRGTAARLGINPEDGLEVIASGRLTTYPGRSKYQMIVERMELAGQGALLKLLEDRRKKLAAEGLFDAERKKPLPFLPAVIGVVTSPTGAVIRDILHRLADRFPRHVLVWPVAVQGDGAAEQVAAAIDGFNALPKTGKVPRPDLLIVARGGGSLEDLWAFNEEIVVRAAAASDIPLISAVGHETDTTLIDFASDQRAPTPTAAAEMAVPVRRDLIVTVADHGQRMVAGAARLLDERRLRLAHAARGLPDLRRRVEERRQALDDRAERLHNALPIWIERRRASFVQVAGRLDGALKARRVTEQAAVARGRDRYSQSIERLRNAMRRRIDDRRAALDSASRLLDTLSYEQVLKRGFALVRDADGMPVMTGAGAQSGDQWTVTFQGQTVVPVTVGEGVDSAPAQSVHKSVAKKNEKTGGQGDLF